MNELIDPFEDFFVSSKKKEIKKIETEIKFENNQIKINENEVSVNPESEEANLQDPFKGLQKSFLTASEACAREEEARASRSIQKMPTYNIKFLNDVCFGILPSELVVVGAGTGIGKCHPKGTKVLMFNGKFKPVDKLSVGDKLMGPDSKARTVLKLYKGYGDIYKIKPTKGECFYVNYEHVLSLKRSYSKGKSKKGDILNISLKD